MTKIRNSFALRQPQLRKLQHQYRSDRGKKAFQIRMVKHHLSRKDLSGNLRKKYYKRLVSLRKVRARYTHILIKINALLNENQNQK